MITRESNSLISLYFLFYREEKMTRDAHDVSLQSIINTKSEANRF